MQDFNVCVTGGGQRGTIAVHPVEEWRIKGDKLIPVYAGGTIPSDESPYTTVSLFPADQTDISPCPNTVHTDGMNEPLVCRLLVGHDGAHELVAL